MTVSRVRVVAVLAMLIALVVVAIAARSSSTHPFTSTATGGAGRSGAVVHRTEAVVTPIPDSDTASALHPRHRGTNWTQVVLLIAALLVVAGVVWRLVESDWSPRRATSPPKHAGPSPEDDQPAGSELRAAVDEGLASLERGDAGEGIIACWLRLEHAASAAGIAVRPSETSTEFVDRVLASYGAREAALRRLSALYSEARFSSHQLGEPSRQEARACLADIRSDLARPHAAT